MPALFSPLKLRSLTLRNRLALSPMCQFAAKDGLPDDWHLIHYGRYAAAGLGLVITEATAVSPQGRITPGCLGIWNDAQQAAFARIVRNLKQFGQTPVGIQLAHAGRKASTALPWEGGASLGGGAAWVTEAPSALPHDAGWHVPEALDAAGLARVRDDFVAGAKRAAAAGFDVAELHAAHGYLLHQFLSPVSNHRTDGYGGSLDKRMRFPLEVAEAVRAVWPADRPLFARITGTDWIGEAGWQVSDAVVLARELQRVGVDLVDVSSGGVSPLQKIPVAPGYQVHLAAAVKAQVGVTTSTVGMIVKPEQAEAILTEGKADLISLGRALLYDPFWAWRAADALGGVVNVPNSYLRGRRLGVDIPREARPAAAPAS